MEERFVIIHMSIMSFSIYPGGRTTCFYTLLNSAPYSFTSILPLSNEHVALVAQPDSDWSNEVLIRRVLSNGIIYQAGLQLSSCCLGFIEDKAETCGREYLTV